MTRRVTIASTISLLLTIASSATGQSSPPPKAECTTLTAIEAKVPASGAFSETMYRGILIEPKAAQATADAKFPLIVFLHGAGERGDDNKIQMQHFPVLCMQEEFQRKHPCFVLAMQCPREELWSLIDIEGIQKRGEQPTFSREPTRAMRGVMIALDEVLATKPIDRARVYLTGLSMGGFGSFDLAARKPAYFAAVAPICGGGDPKTAPIIAGIPFFIVHGDDDPIVPVALSRTMSEAISGASAELARAQRPKPDPANPRPLPKRAPNPMYREYTKVGHASWTPAYTFGEDGILDWMFAQQKSAALTK